MQLLYSYPLFFERIKVFWCESGYLCEIFVNVSKSVIFWFYYMNFKRLKEKFEILWKKKCLITIWNSKFKISPTKYHLKLLYNSQLEIITKKNDHPICAPPTHPTTIQTISTQFHWFSLPNWLKKSIKSPKSPQNSRTRHRALSLSPEAKIPTQIRKRHQNSRFQVRMWPEIRISRGAFYACEIQAWWGQTRWNDDVKTPGSTVSNILFWFRSIFVTFKLLLDRKFNNPKQRG